MNSLIVLFDNVKIDEVLSFLRETGLYQKYDELKPVNLVPTNEFLLNFTYLYSFRNLSLNVYTYKQNLAKTQTTNQPTNRLIDWSYQSLPPLRLFWLYSLDCSDGLQALNSFYLKVAGSWLWGWTARILWLVGILWYINFCRLFNAKSIFIQIVSFISNNSVKHVYTVWFSKTFLFQAIQFSQTVLIQTILIQTIHFSISIYFFHTQLMSKQFYFKQFSLA